MQIKDCIFINQEHSGRAAEVIQSAVDLLRAYEIALPPSLVTWVEQMERIREWNQRNAQGKGEGHGA
jgi:hypothetical protein